MLPCPPLPLCMCVCSPELSHRERATGGIRRFRLVRLVQNGENDVSCRCHSCARILHRIVSYRNRNRNLTSIGGRVLHALRRQPIRTCLRNSASSPLSGRFFEKDFMILPFPLTASLAFFLRETWLCWGKWLPLFYLRFFVASGGGRGPSWPPCRGRKKLRSEDLGLRSTGGGAGRSPGAAPCRISALPRC